MGDPTKVPEAYAASDAIGNAAKISDPLLILHGMKDQVVKCTACNAYNEFP